MLWRMTQEFGVGAFEALLALSAHYHPESPFMQRVQEEQSAYGESRDEQRALLVAGMEAATKADLLAVAQTFREALLSDEWDWLTLGAAREMVRLRLDLPS